ncbi:MAG: hypothetical protein MZV63_42255 [Marinilabiliales bacterium]|nr:hypothetical protein [Marinilabiliales bacterium]
MALLIDRALDPFNNREVNLKGGFTGILNREVNLKGGFTGLPFPSQFRVSIGSHHNNAFCHPAVGPARVISCCQERRWCQCRYRCWD